MKALDDYDEKTAGKPTVEGRCTPFSTPTWIST